MPLKRRNDVNPARLRKQDAGASGAVALLKSAGDMEPQGNILARIAPRSHELLYDLVREAGVDVSDWANSKRGEAHAAANPKYCYQWSFLEPEKLVVLNLWQETLTAKRGSVQATFNMRKKAKTFAESREPAAPVRQKRAVRFDKMTRLAWEEHLPVRVILSEGTRGDMASRVSSASHVLRRSLDPVPWAVTAYNLATGKATVTRGVPAMQFVDQFSAVLDHEGQTPERRVAERSIFARSSGVRRRALLRANGRCEHCGAAGFETVAGQVYLETHHVVPLSEQGADDASNVVALCPNDHRRAHHGADWMQFREDMLRRLAKAASAA